MKQIIMLALVLITITTTAFSNSTSAINQKVLSTFHKSFSNAEDVRWEQKKNLYKATFTIADQTMFAYFNEAGEQVALTRNIVFAQLPMDLAAELQQLYNDGHWLTELLEVSANGESAYYAIVENSSYRTILKATSTLGWMTFKKTKK